MNWPTFLSPVAAGIAAAVTLPLLFLLYFLRLRRRPAKVASTLLWKKAVQDLEVNAPFQKLRRNLLLFLQLLVLIALLLALGRPGVLSDNRPGKTVLLLIDHSASMNAQDGTKGGKTRLDEAKARALEIVNQLSRGARGMVIAFDSTAQIVQPMTTDPNLLRYAIDTIRPTDCPTRIKNAFDLAEAQSAFIPEQLRAQQRPEVWVFTDGRAADIAEASISADVKYQQIGKATSANLGIVAAAGRRNYDNPTEVQVFARLINAGPSPATADLQLLVDGRPARTTSVTIPPSRWDAVQRQTWMDAGNKAVDSQAFSLDLAQAATLDLRLIGAFDDVLPADNAVALLIPPPRPLSVLLVTDGHNAALERAMTSLGTGIAKRDKMDTETYLANPPMGAGAGYDLILFDNFRPTADKLPSAGNFVYFNTIPPGLTTKGEEKSGALLTHPGAVKFIDWQREHPLLRDLSLGRIVLQDSLVVKTTVHTEVLAEGPDGPLIFLERQPHRLHLVIAFDPVASTWVTESSWPAFLALAVRYLSAQANLEVPESLAPGSAPRLPDLVVQRMASRPKELKLALPDHTSVSVAVPPTGDVPLPRLNYVGLYQLTPPVPGFEQFAVSMLDEQESDINPAASLPGSGGQTAVKAGQSKTRLDLWWYLVALGALPILMLEWWLYSRRARV